MFTNEYKNMSIKDLVKYAKDDDTEALEEIIKKVQKNIQLSFVCLCPDSPDISDMTQEVLLKMSKNIKNLKNDDYFKAWLNKIVLNTFYTYLRKKQKLPNCTSADECDENSALCTIKDPCQNVEAKVCNNELKETIFEMIKHLPKSFRIAIILREIAGLSYDEISKVTGVELGTVKSRIARSRYKLQEFLEPYINN